MKSVSQLQDPNFRKEIADLVMQDWQNLQQYPKFRRKCWFVNNRIEVGGSHFSTATKFKNAGFPRLSNCYGDFIIGVIAGLLLPAVMHGDGRTVCEQHNLGIAYQHHIGKIGRGMSAYDWRQSILPEIENKEEFLYVRMTQDKRCTMSKISLFIS